ncbi:hypothetical protein PFISCL1PPCAC_13068, partial [Pristionchus fissidentatus]
FLLCGIGIFEPNYRRLIAPLLQRTSALVLVEVKGDEEVEVGEVHGPSHHVDDTVTLARLSHNVVQDGLVGHGIEYPEEMDYLHERDATSDDPRRPETRRAEEVVAVHEYVDDGAEVQSVPTNGRSDGETVPAN